MRVVSRAVKVRLSLSLYFVVAACGEVQDRFTDGGGFAFLDAVTPDLGVEASPDLGFPDTGPFICLGGCSPGEACGCVAGRCGCQTPADIGGFCDPQAPATCARGDCRIARINGRDGFVCSDGSAGVSCSKRDDRCQTRLGCVCLTPPVGGTDCRCRDSLPAGNIFCDPLNPATCPGAECRRVEGTSGVFFVCANARLGEGCDPRVPICGTSLGCACPFIQGQRTCSCAEPVASGEPCDPFVEGMCPAPLECVSDGQMSPSTTCASMPSGGGPEGSGIPCDPSGAQCPLGERCLPFEGRLVCQRR